MSADLEEERSFASVLITAAVMAYAAAVVVLGWTAGGDLLIFVNTYTPRFAWSFAEVGDDRMDALRSAGQPALAAIYGTMQLFSVFLIAACAVIGAISPFVSKDRRPAADPVTLMISAVSAVFFTIVYLNGPVFTDLLHAARALPNSMSTYPGTWIGTMVVSSLLCATTLGLLLHDVLVSVLGGKKDIPVGRL